MGVIRTLVLSGGGGRGAFHAGVYKYLQEKNKTNVDLEHTTPWTPDVIVGTSIGAVNGAAITQGISAVDLEEFWLSLREKDVQGLPPGMGWLARRVANMILRPAIGTSLPVAPDEIAMSAEAKESWPPLPVMPRGLSERLIGRWNNLLDTGPLHQTLVTRLGLDDQKIANSERTLLISATNVRTGAGVIFSNKDYSSATDKYDYLNPGITTRRIIASCSIPMIYPWTKDVDGEIYWDGAVVDNTPLGPAVDAMRNARPLEEKMEAVIVMMTPWWEGDDDGPQKGRLPKDFGEAIMWTLDWALLASFRRDIKLARTFNKLAAQGAPYRHIDIVIVAPENFLPVTRIIDYDEAASRKLIDAGYEAAKASFTKYFASK